MIIIDSISKQFPLNVLYRTLNLFIVNIKCQATRTYRNLRTCRPGHLENGTFHKRIQKAEFYCRASNAFLVHTGYVRAFFVHSGTVTFHCLHFVLVSLKIHPCHCSSIIKATFYPFLRPWCNIFATTCTRSARLCICNPRCTKVTVIARC